MVIVLVIINYLVFLSYLPHNPQDFAQSCCKEGSSLQSSGLFLTTSGQSDPPMSTQSKQDYGQIMYKYGNEKLLNINILKINFTINY